MADEDGAGAGADVDMAAPTDNAGVCLPLELPFPVL